MKPWDGIFEHYHYKASERLLVDDDGFVYYKTPDGVFASMVRSCAAQRAFTTAMASYTRRSR